MTDNMRVERFDMKDSNKGYIKEKKRLIMDAGSKIFSEKGFHEVKIQEIATEAGVGKGTIYEYFSSKEDLLNAILKMGIERYQSIINFDNIVGNGLWEKLKNYFEANAHFFWDNKEIGRLILRLDHPFQKNLRDQLLSLREDSIRDLEKILTRAKENGELKDISPYIAAKIVRGAIIEVISATVIVEGKNIDKGEVEETIELIKRGLTSE